MKDSLKKLQIHLSKDHNLVLDYEQLEQIQSLVINTRDQSEHVGLFSERIEYNPKEEAFHKEWLKENEIKSHVNYGHGLLQDLFFDRERNCVLEINTRDREVVATVIQWLGSNIGMMFLGNVLKTVGYKITKIKD